MCFRRLGAVAELAGFGFVVLKGVARKGNFEAQYPGIALGCAKGSSKAGQNA